MRPSIGSALVVPLLCLSSLALSDTPTGIFLVQQGRLVGADDKPVSSSVSIAVTLYASKDESDGTWTDTFPVTPDANGVYVITLGSHTELKPTDLAGRRYIGISVGGTDLLPRLRIGTTPLAMQAVDAQTVGGHPASDFALKADVPAVAADSLKLAGVEAAKYALKTDVPAVAADSQKLNGLEAAKYALKTDVPSVAADSLKLNGLEAAQYALKTDVAPDSLKLNGLAGSAYLQKTGFVDGNSKVLLGALPTGTAGSAAGLASLDATGKIPTAALPDSVLSGGTNPTFQGLTVTGSIAVNQTAPKARVDVGGAIRIGYANEVCDATTNGMLRFASARLEYCSGGRWLLLAAAPATAQTIETFGTGRRWTDGTYAKSCNDYRNPASGFSYAGTTGSGIYTVKQNDSTSATDVYCDMSIANGGWTRVYQSVGETNATSIPYTPGTSGNDSIVSRATSMMIAFIEESSKALSNAYTFPMPAVFTTQTPLANTTCGYVSITATRVSDSTQTSQLLRYGPSSFGSNCDEGCSGTHGQICLKNSPSQGSSGGYADFPMYTGFATTSPDNCSLSSQSYTTTPCSAARQWVIFVR